MSDNNRALRLNFEQDYTGRWNVADENYDYSDDLGASPTGSGETREEALIDYFRRCGFDNTRSYQIEG